MFQFDSWLSDIKEHHSKADEKVLRFIYDFITMQNSETANEVIYNQFAKGYCFYFANILKVAFNRGEVCWVAPFGHIVWVDNNEEVYDIGGCYDGESVDFIPIYMMGDSIKDFKHIKYDRYNTTEQEIATLILEWNNIKHYVKDSEKPHEQNVINMCQSEAIAYVRDNYKSDNEVVISKVKYILNKFIDRRE